MVVRQVHGLALVVGEVGPVGRVGNDEFRRSVGDGKLRGAEGELVLPQRQRRRRRRHQLRLQRSRSGWFRNRRLRNAGFWRRFLDGDLLRHRLDLAIRFEKEIGIPISRIIITVHHLNVVCFHIIIIIRTDHVMRRYDPRLI